MYRAGGLRGTPDFKVDSLSLVDCFLKKLNISSEERLKSNFYDG